ncbi:MAG: carbohydrate kinase [Leptolyngbya sp. SIO4C1]|nr:carbohydrate kinase [Leptolyngbya sp. SIO4C1]
MRGSVVCLGEILVDCFVTAVAQEEAQSLPGGAPANVACGLARLGVPTEFIGAVGDDRWGHALKQLLADLNVGSLGVQQLALPTRQVQVLLNEQGDRSFAGFGEATLPDDFADAHLQATAIEPALFAQVKYLVLGTISLAYEETQAAVQHAIALTRQQQGRVMVDINWRPMFWPQPATAPTRIHALLLQADLLKLSAEEAIWLFETRDPRAIAAQFPNLDGVLVTVGAAGCRYWLGGHVGELPGFTVDVEDTTGAGDAFVAGFLTQLYRHGHHSLQTAETARAAVRFASAVGALTTTRAGAIAAQPTPKEVEAFLFLHR